jgi:TDG/mug DNA glycosylase family protein
MPSRSAARKPTPDQIAGAHGKKVADVIAPGLEVLFCGINPGLYSAAIGCHFGRPGNRFWPTLHAAGFTDRRLAPSEQRELLRAGYGITNLVGRATATASELSAAELVKGGRRLERKVIGYSPAVIAFLGVTAYRTAFSQPRAALGLQQENLGKARIWVLPNPSGLNAHYALADLTRVFRELRLAVESDKNGFVHPPHPNPDDAHGYHDAQSMVSACRPSGSGPRGS